jgi:A/G-specific adenine glycosylase
MSPASTPPPRAATWITRHQFRPSDLPTVMRKAWDLARDHITD